MFEPCYDLARNSGTLQCALARNTGTLRGFMAMMFSGLLISHRARSWLEVVEEFKDKWSIQDTDDLVYCMGFIVGLSLHFLCDEKNSFSKCMN